MTQSDEASAEGSGFGSSGFGSGSGLSGLMGSGTVDPGQFGSGTVDPGQFGSGTVDPSQFGSGTVEATEVTETPPPVVNRPSRGDTEYPPRILIPIPKKPKPAKPGKDLMMV